MKRYILALIILLNTVPAYSEDYTQIDKQSETVPANLKTPSEIAHYLTQNLTLPTDKTRAIYYWISHNIRYDIKKLNSGKTYNNPQEILDEVMQYRQGVCQHYAELFHACCESVGVESYVISGYTNQTGELGNLSHAWNAVLINGKFYEVDVTWAAGHLINRKYIHEFADLYFLISPSEFIKSHIPYDPIWQFLNNPITHKDFQKSNFSKLKTSSNFNFNDSIKLLSHLNLLEKTIRENNRIRHSGITNNQLQKQVAFNQQIIITEKLNTAVNLYNKGVEDYNVYIFNKNKQFQDKNVTEKQLLGFLSTARRQVESAERLLIFLNSDNSNLNKQISDMQKSIVKMKSDIKNEDNFMEKYRNTLKPVRIFLFTTGK